MLRTRLARLEKAIPNDAPSVPDLVFIEKEASGYKVTEHFLHMNKRRTGFTLRKPRYNVLRVARRDDYNPPDGFNGVIIFGAEDLED